MKWEENGEARSKDEFYVCSVLFGYSHNAITSVVLYSLYISSCVRNSMREVRTVPRRRVKLFIYLFVYFFINCYYFIYWISIFVGMGKVNKRFDKEACVG